MISLIHEWRGKLQISISYSHTNRFFKTINEEMYALIGLRKLALIIFILVRFEFSYCELKIKLKSSTYHIP